MKPKGIIYFGSNKKEESLISCNKRREGGLKVTLLTRIIKGRRSKGKVSEKGVSITRAREKGTGKGVLTLRPAPHP